MFHFLKCSTLDKNEKGYLSARPQQHSQMGRGKKKCSLTELLCHIVLHPDPKSPVKVLTLGNSTNTHRVNCLPQRLTRKASPSLLTWLVFKQPKPETWGCLRQRPGSCSSHHLHHLPEGAEASHPLHPLNFCFFITQRMSNTHPDSLILSLTHLFIRHSHENQMRYRNKMFLKLYRLVISLNKHTDTKTTASKIH